MTDDEEYNLGNNNNAIAQPKKPNAILNLAIARESLANAKKMCEQHREYSPLKLVMAHRQMPLPMDSGLKYNEGRD